MMGQFIQIIEMVFKDERESLKVSLSTVYGLKVMRDLNTCLTERLRDSIGLRSGRLSSAPKQELIMRLFVRLVKHKTAKVRPTCWATGRWTAHGGALQFCKVSRGKKTKDGKTPKYGILEAVCLRRDQRVSSPASVCLHKAMGNLDLDCFKSAVHLSGLH